MVLNFVTARPAVASESTLFIFIDLNLLLLLSNSILYPTFLNKDVNPENIKRAIEMCGTLKNKELFYCEINDMFDKEADASTKLVEFNSKSIPKETLSRIIYNVRKAEGYSETEASKKSEDFIYEGERSLWIKLK